MVTNMKIKFFPVLIFIALVCGNLPAQERIVLGGSKAVIMVVDAVYLFPEAGSKVVASAKGDQGLGIFLAAIDPSYAKRPIFETSAGAETYASFKPDLVIMKSANKKSLGPALDALGIQQLYLNLENPDDYYSEITLLGKLFKNEKRAAEVVAWYKSEVKKVTDKTAFIKQTEKRKVLVLQPSAGAEGVWEVPPASWIQTMMVELSGGIPVWTSANPGSGWAKVNAEQIAAWNPDVIFMINYKDNPEKSAENLLKDGRLAGVSAVKSSSVYGFVKDFYSWDQPDTRWILGLRWMAATLNPALFPDFSAISLAKNFFNFAYGMDEKLFNQTIMPRLSGTVEGKAGK